MSTNMMQQSNHGIGGTGLIGNGSYGGKMTHLNKIQQTAVMREPTYCFCNNVSYGDMIACDNKGCPYEWFHFPCVGLMQKPEGKWFCLKCQQTMGNRVRNGLG